MTWPDRIFFTMLASFCVLYVGDCTTKAMASGPSDIVTVGRDLVRAIDRNTAAVEKAGRCR